MSWTTEEVAQFQSNNTKELAEINATLRPDKGLSGEVGVFLFGQMGDLMTAMSVLKYRREIFGDKNIIWYANSPNADCLRYAPITEVRPWPWAGNGLPVGTPDYWPLLCNSKNKLDLDKAAAFADTKTLAEGYFPAPYMVKPVDRHNIDYPNVSRKIFGVPDDYNWRPYLSFSDEECDKALLFATMLPGNKNVFFETFAGSGQSLLDEEMVLRTMQICREKWGECNFIFASHKFLKKQEQFPIGFFNSPNVFNCAHFTPRQCALVAEFCDIMISVSSGITVAASAWGIKHPPIIQFCGSFICSTKSLAHNQFELITCDGKRLADAKAQYYLKLIQILNTNNE